MGERRRGEIGEPGTGFPEEPEEPGSLLQRAVSVLQSSSLHSSSQHGFQFSQAILVENDLFLRELQAFARAKEAAGYSPEELQETFAFLLFDKEEEAKEVCQSGLRVNSSSISTLGDPAKGVYISKYSDCLQPGPWQPGKSGYIVICKLIKGKVRAIAESSSSSSSPCPSPGYDCHVSSHSPSSSSQYYVYEVSGGCTAQRPRQVCPYIFLCCQYREPGAMPVPAPRSLTEQSHPALYCPWRGQLSIQGRLLCTITLRNPHSPTIPAQLPPNLDIKHVMGLADLKKKLPEAAFGKKNYTGHEVCFQGVYSSLYEVEISNKDQSKMDQLLEKLKEKDLAIIKYLQDQGVLILLTSSALAREEGLDAKEPVALLALFLFPSPRALSPPAARQDPKDGRGSHPSSPTPAKKERRCRNPVSLRIASVLPGLRYALRRAADSSCGAPDIHKHLQEYAKLQGNSAGKKNPLSSLPPAWQDDEGAHRHHPPHPDPSSQKVSARSLALLHRYLGDPSSFTLGISAALGCLSRARKNSGAAPNSSSSSSSPSELPSPPQGTASPEPSLDDFSKSVTSPTKPWGRESRRKSSRISGKNLSPLQAAANPGGGDKKGKGAGKKKRPLAPSAPKKSGGCSEPMLKLAKMRLPHGRKRGAEVLAAEIVHKPQREGGEKETSAAPEGGEAKKPKVVENSGKKNKPGAESGPRAGKNKLQKNGENNKGAESPEELQEQSGLKEPLPDLPSESSSSSSSPSQSQSPSQGAATPRNEINPMGIPRNEINPMEIPGKEINSMEIPGKEINPMEIPGKEINSMGIPRNEINPMEIPGKEINSLTSPGIQRNEINSLTIPGNPLTIPGIQRTEISPLTIPAVSGKEIYSLTIPTIQRTEINSLTIPGIPRNEIVPLAIPGITINSLTIPGNSLTIPGISGNSLTIPAIPRSEINSLTIPGNSLTIPGNSLTIPAIPRSEINSLTIPGNSLTIPGNSLTIPGVQRNEINSLTIPGNSLTIPAIPRSEINSLAIPGIQRNEINSLTIPGNSLTIPGNSLTIPGIPKNDINPFTVAGIQRNEINSLTLPGNSLTLPGNSLTIPAIPRNEVNPLTLPAIPGNSLTIPSLGFALQGPNSESHALNLLADLALGSCIPTFIPKDSGIILLESRDSSPQPLPVAPPEPQSQQENETNPTPSQDKTPQSHQENPEKTHPEDHPPTEKNTGIPILEETSGIPSLEETSGIPSLEKNSEIPSLEETSGIPSLDPTPAAAQSQLSPPGEAAELNKHSIISDEHSYASPMPDDPENPSQDPKEIPNPTLTPPKTNPRNIPAAPLVGKVLPFRHQHSNTPEAAQGRAWGRRKEEFSRRHTVLVSGDSLEVTCHWEEEYLFHLDSRYTNDPLEKSVTRALHGPWDPDLPDDVEGMKLILHMWVALFYRKPSKLLSSSRKVVEHINPKKFVSINSSGAFPELSDDSQDCLGLETCPADSAWDPDQTPSSSLDPNTPSQGPQDPKSPSQGCQDPKSPSTQVEKEHSQAFPADSQSDADGTPGDSTVSSSSGELPCGEEEEEEEPSSTSCAEGLALPEHSRERLEVAHGETEVVPQESARGVCSGTAEEPAKEELLDARITPSPPQELNSPSKSLDAPNPENPGSQTPNSSTAPWAEPQEEKQQEKQQEEGSGSGPGPPEDEEGTGDSGQALEDEDDAGPQPADNSTPLESNPRSAEPGGATEEGEGSQELSQHSEKEEKEEENEEFEDEGSFQGPVDLVLSESSDAEMECEQNPGNSAPEEEPGASPTSLAPPCAHRSPPELPDGAGSDPGEDSQEVSPHQDQLRDPWDVPAPNGAEAGAPRSPPGELQCPPEPSPAPGAQPDSRGDSPAPAGDTPGCSEQGSRAQAPSGERWEGAGSTESPCRGQGMSLALSPDSSSVCLTSPDGSLDPWAAPEDPPMDSIQSPAQSELGRGSSLSQLGGDEADPHLNSRDNEESNQGGNEVLGEEEQGSPCAKGVEELDDPMGAGDGLGESPLAYPATGDESRAEEREDEFPEAENSPGNDTRSTETEIPLQQADREFLPQPEPSSSSREGISAIQELPRQQQNLPAIPGDSAPAPGDPGPGVPGRRESVLCRLWKPCRDGGAAQLSIPAWGLDSSSLHPSCSQGLTPAPCSPRDELGPAEPGSAPPSPCDAWDDEEPLPGVFPPSPDSWSQSCASPRNSRGSPQEEPEDVGTGSIPSPAAFPSWECTLCEPWEECEHNPEGPQPFPDPGTEVGEGEIPGSPSPASPWDEHGDLPGEQLEFSDAEEIPEQLPSQDTHEGLAFGDPSENSFGDSELEYFQGNSHSRLPSRNSCIMRAVDAAGARTSRDSSSRSSLHTEEHGEDWDWDIPRDPGGPVLSRQCQERMGNSQHPKRHHHHHSRESHLSQSLLGTWRSSEEITQGTLDMECLRFHYKLKETLRKGRPPFSSTSNSIFPPSPRSRSPLQVTIPPSDTWAQRWAGSRGRSQGRGRDPRAPVHLGKLRYLRAPPEPCGDIGDILHQYSHFPRVLLGRARAGRDPPGPFQAGQGQAGPEPFWGMMEELRGALRSHLRRVAAAAARPTHFFLLETGQEPLFDRAKALLQARGFVRTEPQSFLGSRCGERLLVVVRNEDISSHIHTVPALLELKRCPGAVFAGVDGPEELTADTFQELFQAGGFLVSDEELLERVTLGQLQEVVKVLEKLNRNGRWKWLLHHRESRRLRGDPRDDAQKKQQLLRRCQGEELLELLPFHACDSSGARRVPCLLELQVQHIHARFAVYLTENPGSSREILESKGILVADINTFLGTVQELAAPFRRTYW